MPFHKNLKDFISGKATSIRDEINSKPDEYFESVPLEEYLEYLISAYELPYLPELHWSETSIDIGEVMISGRFLPSDFRARDLNEKYPFNEVTYHIPFSGEDLLLKYHSTGRVTLGGGSTRDLRIEGNFLVLPIIDYRGDPKKLEFEFDRSKKAIIDKCNDINFELERARKTLPNFIQKELNKRVEKINKANDYKSQFNFPIRKKGNVAKAFQVPNLVKKKKIKPQPVGRNKSDKKEMQISDADFKHILSILQECGKNWEQHPDIYKGKGEEALRDQLIFVLAPNIEGVVAGEAYNKKGKTDIAIKYESTNLFIGECKIWKGASVFTKTIDQILGYLTWRDSKSAIMMFVPNADISSVIETAKKTIQQHPNFVRELEVINDGWVNYRFHLTGDEGSYLTIAVHLYHMPEL